MIAGVFAGCASQAGSSDTIHASPHASAQQVTNAIGKVVANHYNDPSATVHCRVGPRLATCATGTRSGGGTLFDADIASDGTITVHRLGKYGPGHAIP